MFIRLLLLAALLPSLSSALRAITLSLPNTPQFEDFNTLSVATGSSLPTDWNFLETGSGANTTYGASNGGSSTGNTYSFGATGDTDRALGSLRTSSVASVFGLSITNSSALTLAQIDLQYLGEQWRLGATGRVDRLDFSYSLDASSLSTGTWVDLDGLDFIAPVTAGATGALDGNSADNRSLVSGSIPALSLAPGATLWIRWSDYEASGSDDGLAIDNLTITGIAAAGPVGAVPDHLPLGWCLLPLLAVVRWHRRHARSA